MRRSDIGLFIVVVVVQSAWTYFVFSRDFDMHSVRSDCHIKLSDSKVEVYNRTGEVCLNQKGRHVDIHNIDSRECNPRGRGFETKLEFKCVADPWED